MSKHSYTFDDILLLPQYSEIRSRKDVDISSTTSCGKLRLELPVMSSNMDTITESAMANFMASKGGIGVLHRFMSIERNVEEYKKSPPQTFVSIGVTDGEKERMEALYTAGANEVCVDVAHGHSVAMRDMLKWLRGVYGNSILIMAGNVATYEGTLDLLKWGADIVKVGIGNGSKCTTRGKTGHGVPQLSAIGSARNAVNDYRDWVQDSRVKSIVSDGGVYSPGDIVKALAFGADFVMTGNMLAGTRPTPGDTTVRNLSDGCFHTPKNRLVKEYRGSASQSSYDVQGKASSWRTAEGVSKFVPYRDDEDAIIADIEGGLRSGLSYSGARNIKELQEKMQYVVITSNGVVESGTEKQKL